MWWLVQLLTATSCWCLWCSWVCCSAISCNRLWRFGKHWWKQNWQIRLKLFTKHFTPAADNVLQSWSKVGFVPFTRNFEKSKKVHHELGQQQRGNSPEDLQALYTSPRRDLVNSAEEHGLNAWIFTEWKETRWGSLLGSFSASDIWS